MPPFAHLLPKVIIESLRSQGLTPTGALLPFNSYENRVYQIPLEDRDPVIAKFYRPGRWSAAAIADEHRFVSALLEHDIPVVAPLALRMHRPEIESLGDTLGPDPILYALYPKFRGRERDELTNDDRKWLGRTLARLHTVGSRLKHKHRLELTPDTYGYDSLEFILKQSFLPGDLLESIEAHLLQALDLLTPAFDQDMEWIPVHGDCHLGNILWNDDGPYLVDFDDTVVAPPVQDVWMLFSGDRDSLKREQDAFFEGYTVFRPFDLDTLSLAEPLRTLRMIRHAAWIGMRYDDPAFQKAFPYYEERRYWEKFLLEIKEQISLLQEIF